MAFEPQKENGKKWIDFKCPLKFGYPELEQNCIKEKCAWWLKIQKSCSIPILSYGIGLKRIE